ncbi:DUF1153 domain-containing protein [Aromatoleum toluclasticum]|nr:DUF1153 domain-containing protein [Aromatoleum toluclasticum]MCC4115458.1 DUF1153 domain-containing protein [Aromatoleum toluclasticum]
MIRIVRICFLAFSLLAPPCVFAQIVIVAGAHSPLPELALEQAEQFYLGRAHTLPDGSVVTLADLPPGSIRDHFYQQLTRKNYSQIRAYWSRMVFTGRALPPQQADSVAELRQWLAAQPNLIGYMPAAEADGRVKVLLRLP